MPTYNFINRKTGEEYTQAMKIAEMEKLISESDWEVDITKNFPAMTSDGGLGRNKPDEGFKDLLGEMKKKHNNRGGKINDFR